MIEFKIENGVASLNVEGDAKEMFADTAVMIRRIYDTIKATDPTKAEIYLFGIATVITDPDSPFFKEEIIKPW